ncbi:MAG: nuclear transport factor 2 family protein [Hydrocarboniphaga sp.]|uniref:nuclear transport factor 2 family protein n=1 Tax=Hydrocarboniphaga sp. TaxID=2033016 RepID=UPI00260DCCE6|nr:nuclear transport factor 2 family protein [Hydrocarboniphaga sp.]MDB5970624.1 nuclear transport factor 2 family protein [Hydrocarboniphaga sp.]
MDRIDELFAIEQIRQLKARYFECIDGKLWSEWGALFADDATMDIAGDQPGPGSVVKTAAAITETVSRMLTGVTSVHHGHMPRIEMLSADKATGIWAMEDLLVWAEDAPRQGPFTRLHGYGHYHETYVRKGEAWRIQSLRLTRLHVELC